MLILLTNDDGITAPGLLAIYRELTALGEVHVVAPASVQSATGHGITLSTPLLTNRINVGDAFTGVAVEGRPADCVKLAVAQLLPRAPDLVVSGLNSGANVGINVIYSGTVAAAIEAAFLGLPSAALSLHLGSNGPPDYGRAAKLAKQALDRVLKIGLGKGQVVSINVPNLKAEESPAGMKIVRQCTRPWVDTYDRRVDPRGREYFWNSSVFTLGATEEDTDVAALRDRYVTITPLEFDLTDHEVLGRWRRGFEDKGR
jgi:5'-nucleotidase